MKYQRVGKKLKCFEKNHALLQAWFLFFWKSKNVQWDWRKFTQSFSGARCKFLVEPVLTGSDSKKHWKKGRRMEDQMNLNLLLCVRRKEREQSCWMLWQRRAGLAAPLVGAASSEEKLVWAVRGSDKARGRRILEGGLMHIAGHAF